MPRKNLGRPQDLGTVSDWDESADGFGVGEAGAVVGDGQAGFDGIECRSWQRSRYVAR